MSGLIRLLLALGCALLAAPVWAAFPERPVHFFVGVAPGGSNDVVTRLIAQKLSEQWSQQVIVENRTGAEGTLAADLVSKSPPDGYAILLVTSAHTIVKSDVKIGYDPIKSFSPITYVGVQPQILIVNNTVPAKSLNELIALAKAKPGQLNFGSGGLGTPTYTSMALLMKMANIDLVNVTYRGGAPTLAGLLAGDIQTMFGSITVLLETVKAGGVRALAVSSLRRFSGLPDLPTVAEAANLPGFDAVNWFGVVGPAGIPKDVVAKLHADIVAAINSADLQKKFLEQGLVTIGDGPEPFEKMMVDDMAKWKNF